MDYPYEELIDWISAKGNNLPNNLTKDIQAGISYAFSTLEEEEQQVLLLRCGKKLEYGQIAAQMGMSEDAVRQLEKKALHKLRLPGRWNYIHYGVNGYLRRRIAEEHRKSYQAGFTDGYRQGQEREEAVPDGVLDLPLEMLGLSAYAFHCLSAAGIRTIRDAAELEDERFRRIRNLGPKTGAEVARALQARGITHTVWDKFA